MAVLPGLSHVSVGIRVAGEIATEHEVPSDQAPVGDADTERPSTHCYIEAKTSAEFSVEMTVQSDFRFRQGTNALSMHVYIDGTWVRAKFAPEVNSPWRTNRTIEAGEALCYADQEGGEPVLKNFAFSAVVTSETVASQDMTNEVRRVRSLGVIKVVLTVGIIGDPITLTPTNGFQNQEREIPEKALKGRELSHRGALTASTKLASRRGTHVTEVEKLGTIFFYYRSHEALQREMIIPRSPSAETQPPATSSPADSNLANLSQDEIRRLAGERLRDLQVKSESGRVKREAESVPRVVRPLKVIKLDDGREAFDLTEDD
ncbi:hypothetical protein NCS52_00707900 [Fusarium sp. LHS14.1]|nr:hypothetical protein NCS52_00707900 [Fusarium sp. LHS14.1]